MAEKQYVDSAHIEANGNFDRSWRDEKWGDRQLSVAARDVAMEEKEMTILEAIRANPMAIFWSLVLSTCVVMEGYDTNLLSNFYAYRECWACPPGAQMQIVLTLSKHLSRRNTVTLWESQSRRRAAISL